jgi:hypothetical protein
VAADVVLLLHVAFVIFVVAGLLLILLGRLLRWPWIRSRWFRITHLVAIAVVVLQSWAGIICPLTTFEMTLRAKAGDATYSGSFIANWLETLLYIEAPAWVFALCYSLFAGLVLATWFWIPPHRRRSG